MSLLDGGGSRPPALGNRGGWGGGRGMCVCVGGMWGGGVWKGNYLVISTLSHFSEPKHTFPDHPPLPPSRPIHSTQDIEETAAEITSGGGGVTSR